MENLYDYGFWYNSYESVWYAIPRESWTLFFSGKEDKDGIEGVMRSSEIDTLVAVICNPDLIQYVTEEYDEVDDFYEDIDPSENWPEGDHWGE